MTKTPYTLEQVKRVFAKHNCELLNTVTPISCLCVC